MDLADRVRIDLGRIIVDRFRDAQSRISAIVLDPRVEQELRRSVQDKNVIIDPLRLEKLIVALANAWRKAHVAGQEAALLTDGQLRRPLRAALVRSLADLSVISYQEIPNDVGMLPIAMIRPEDLNA
jgi:flagellar biosynthesis protein FlhA